MSPLHPSTPWVPLALSCIFVLHWSLVSCKLQHDPGGSWALDLHDTKAAIGKYFNYSLPSPPSRIAGNNFHYEVSEVGTSVIPTWLVFNKTSHTLHGVPLITDKGFYLMKVSLISLSENASSVQAHDVFAIDVDFGTSNGLTKKDILEGVGARSHQMLYTVQQLSEHIACRRNEIKTLMSVVFDADMNNLNGSSRVSLISRLAPFVNQPLEEFRISSKHSSVIDKLQADTVVAAGPGNIYSAGSREGVVVSWPLPCAMQALINQFPKVMARNIASGHFRDTTGYDVISWYISKVRDSDVKGKGRSRREAGMTVAPTPKPSQTASVITATSLLSISSTIQSTQTLFTSSFVSTLLFSPSSSDQTMSFFSSSPSGFILSTTPLGYSSTQISLFSQSASLETLTSLVSESVQPSLSQSPFMTSFATFILSSRDTLFSSSIQVSQLSPTPQERSTIYSSYQTTILSTIMDSSESTIAVGSSSLLMSSNEISPSTSVFPSFQSTSSLLGSPSLFLSTEVMSTSLLITESPRMSSDESVQTSNSVTSVTISSQSSPSVSMPSMSDLSSVFSSNFPSTLQSSEPETSFIFQTSSNFRSESLSPSTRFPSTSSLILSSTLIGTSDVETQSISSFRYTSSDISTPLQTTHTTPASTLLSTQLSLSSPMLTTVYSSSEIIMSSTESLQASSGLTLISYIATSSERTMTSLFSTETMLSSEIQTSFFPTQSFPSTYQTEVPSSMMTTDVTTATTRLPSSQIQTEIQSSDIVQSMTILTTATMAPSMTLSSKYSASPGTSSTASSTSLDLSVSDTSSSQLVPSTLIVTPSTLSMISSSFVVPDTTSVSSVIGVSSLFSTGDITVPSSLLSQSLSNTDISIESTYLSEFLSSTMFPDTSSLFPSLSSESPYLSPSFLKTTELSVSTSLSLTTTTLPISTSEMISQIQSSQISSGTLETSAPETEMTMMPTTYFRTPVISSVSAVTTLASEVSTTVSRLSSGTPFLSESSLVSLHSSSASDFPVLSTSAAPSLSSAMFVSSSALSVSLAPSEQTMTASQDTPIFSATSQIFIHSSSASDFPVLSTSVTQSLSSPFFESSFAPSVFSTSISLAPSKQTMTASQDTSAFSTVSPLSLYSSSASDFPVFSTIMTTSLSSVSFASSTATSVSSVSDSLAPSKQTMTASQDTSAFSKVSPLSLYSSSASDFPVFSTIMTTSLSSVSFASSTATSVSSVSDSLAPSEQTMTASQDTSAFSTVSPLSLYSSSASDFPVFSTIMTPSFSSVSFASSTAPSVSSVSDSFAPSVFPSTASQETTSLGLESDHSSTTLFFSEVQSETLTSSFFGTSTSQHFASSSSAVVRSSPSQSDILSSTVVQPSMSTTNYMLTSSTGAPSTLYSSTVYSLTSLETPDLSSSLSYSQATTVPSLITSSVPETTRLVSTMSPQLSTSSQPVSTRAPSKLFSSTQGVFMSSSSSPTSSPVSSTLEVMPSSTLMLASSPTVVQPSSTAVQTSGLSSLPSSDVSLPMSSLLVSTSAIQPTPSYSSQVEVVSTSAVATEPTTQPAETTTEPVNQAPIIQYPIDEINVALGDVLQFSIPEDTFFDPEDGLTFDLRLDLLTTENQPVNPSHWLQLDNSQQTLAGVPLDGNLTTLRNEYLLSATDSEGLVAYDAFVVKVQERALDYNHIFVITLENDFQSFVEDSQNIASLCDEVASFLDDVNADAFSVASVAEGSVVVTYSNKTISTKYCDYESIDDVYSSLAYSNGTPTDAFQDALLPNNVVTDVERIFLNLCSMTTMPPVTNVTESSGTETNLLLVTVLPASLVSLLLLICFLIICCCYKRKRGGEEFLLREEKPIYAKNRKPVYLDGELGDKEPRGASHPVILPIDVDPVKSSRPFKRKSREPSSELRPPPPQYRLPEYARVNLGMDDIENDFENNLYEMEPPTYTSQPVLHNASDSNPQDDKPPPLYRLPPPYQSQDRGFFDESDI